MDIRDLILLSLYETYILKEKLSRDTLSFKADFCQNITFYWKAHLAWRPRHRLMVYRIV